MSTKKEWVIITGGSRGIGFAAAQAFAEEGYNLVLIARNKRDLKAAKASLASKVVIYSQDLSRLSQVNKLTQKILKQHRPVKGLVLNAGYSLNANADETTYQEKEKEMNLNYWSPSIFIENFLPNFKRQKRDNFILATGSLTAFVPFPGNASYAASKAALFTYMRNLAIELKMKDRKVYVGTVVPGLTETGLTQKLKTPFSPMAPEKVAKAMLKLLDDKDFYRVPGKLNRFFLKANHIFPGAINTLYEHLGEYFIPKEEL